MSLFIADTFADSLTRLTAEEQKAVKVTIFDLHANPSAPGLQLHRVDQAKDPSFWSARVNRDVRLILHRPPPHLPEGVRAILRLSEPEEPVPTVAPDQGAFSARWWRPFPGLPENLVGRPTRGLGLGSHLAPRWGLGSGRRRSAPDARAAL